MVRYTKANPKNIVKCVEAGVHSIPWNAVASCTVVEYIVHRYAEMHASTGAVKCLVEHLSDRDAVLRRHACKLLSLLSGVSMREHRRRHAPSQ
jgi:hypothetical protein